MLSRGRRIWLGVAALAIAVSALLFVRHHALPHRLGFVLQPPSGQGAPGAAGSAGPAGTSAFSTTTVSFTQPAVGSTVGVVVGSTAWVAAGETLYVATGGYYTVARINSPIALLLTNTGATGNAAVGATIATGQTVTPSGPAGPVSASRPGQDANTVLAYRFNELVPGVLVNHGSYGTASSPIGPVPTTLTASFVQPAVGSTVVASVASSTGYQASQLIIVGSRVANGGGGNYYYCTAAGSGTLTLKNLGITGALAPSGTVSASSVVATSMDLLYPDVGIYPTLGATGLTDYAQFFGDTSSTPPGWSNAYSDGYAAGGAPDFNGLTHASIHILIRRILGTGNNQSSQWFGYSAGRAWASPFQTLGASISGNSQTGVWTASGGGQSWTFAGGSAPTSWGFADSDAWNLLSITFDATATANAVKYYKNGTLVAQQSTSATGSIQFSSTGYFYVGAPDYSLGDTGDRTYATYGEARFDNVTRNAAYIQALYQSYFPGSVSWPVP